MKKVAIMIIICLGTFGCQGQIKESEIIGKWKVIDFKAETPELSTWLITAGREQAMSSEYTILNEGKSILKSNYYSNGRNGKWEYSVKTQTLTITHSNESDMGPESYTIESLDEKKMIWIQNLQELGTISLILEKR